MLLNSSDLQSFLTSRAIAGEILRPGVPTPTVESAARALGVPVEQIVKSILCVVKDAGDPKYVLAIACGTAYVDRRLIAVHYGVGHKRVRLAFPEEVLAVSGYAVGAMPPFGHRQPLPTLVDRRVLALPVVFAGGGDEDAMLRLDPQDIVRITGAVVMDLSGTPQK